MSSNGYNLSDLERSQYKPILSALEHHPEGLRIRQIALSADLSPGTVSKRVRELRDQYGVVTIETLGDRKSSDKIVRLKIHAKEKENLRFNIETKTFRFRPNETDSMVVGFYLKELSKKHQMNIIPFLLDGLGRVQSDRFSTVFNNETGLFQSMIYEDRLEEVEEYLREYIYKNFSKNEISKMQNIYFKIRSIESERSQKLIQDIRNLKLDYDLSDSELIFISLLQHTPHLWSQNHISWLKYFIEEGDVDMEPDKVKDYQKQAKLEIKTIQKNEEDLQIQRPEINKKIQIFMNQFVKLLETQKNTIDSFPKA